MSCILENKRTTLFDLFIRFPFFEKLQLGTIKVSQLLITLTSMSNKFTLYINDNLYKAKVKQFYKL